MELTTHKGIVQSEDRKYLMWLKANNPFYADVAIDYESLERLSEDGLPDDLPTVEDPESNEEQDPQQEDTGE